MRSAPDRSGGEQKVQTFEGQRIEPQRPEKQFLEILELATQDQHVLICYSVVV